MLGFKTEKAIQATAHLLKRKPGRRANYMLLLKLLYLAERKSLELRGSPLYGDRPFAMNQGPVLSSTLDLIKGNDPASPKWDQFIERKGFDIELIKDPGNLSLSRAELKILDEISTEFADYCEWELILWCHENLPEFKKNDPGNNNTKRNPISLEDVLENVGRSGQAEEILKQVNERLGFNALFQDHAVK